MATYLPEIDIYPDDVRVLLKEHPETDAMKKCLQTAWPSTPDFDPDQAILVRGKWNRHHLFYSHYHMGKWNRRHALLEYKVLQIMSVLLNHRGFSVLLKTP